MLSHWVALPLYFHGRPHFVAHAQAAVILPIYELSGNYVRCPVRDSCVSFCSRVVHLGEIRGSFPSPVPSAGLCTAKATGCWVQVFRAYDIETGTEVALKIHCLDNKVPQGGGQKEYVRRAIREVNILEPLRHQCIVRLHHVFEITDTSFAIVMEACKGSLHLAAKILSSPPSPWSLSVTGSSMHCRWGLADIFARAAQQAVA
jgi:hypothetical protein